MAFLVLSRTPSNFIYIWSPGWSPNIKCPGTRIHSYTRSYASSTGVKSTLHMCYRQFIFLWVDSVAQPLKDNLHTGVFFSFPKRIHQLPDLFVLSPLRSIFTLLSRWSQYLNSSLMLPLKSASDFCFSHCRAGGLYRKGAGFYGPFPNVLCLPFVCGRVLTKEYFISEKWENTKTKENSRRRPNSNSLVMKQSQGPLAPSQGLSIIFWAISCELSYKYL